LRLIYIDVESGEYVEYEADEKKPDFEISQFLIKSQELLKRREQEKKNLEGNSENDEKK
jgi:hypothetical protein